MIAVLKHELRLYFHSLTAYVFGAFLLAFIGIGSVLYNLQAAVSEIAPDGAQRNSLSWEIRETLENGAVNVFPEKVQKINFSWVYQLCGREDLSYCRMKFGEAAWPCILATCEQAWLDDVTKIIDKPSWYNATDAETFISESVMAFISGDAELTPESWAAFLEKLDTTYQYGEFIDYANGYYHELSGK